MKRTLIIIGFLLALPAAMQAQDWGYVPLGGGSSTATSVWDQNGYTIFPTGVGFDSTGAKLQNDGRLFLGNSGSGSLLFPTTSATRFVGLKAGGSTYLEVYGEGITSGLIVPPPRGITASVTSTARIVLNSNYLDFTGAVVSSYLFWGAIRASNSSITIDTVISPIYLAVTDSIRFTIGNDSINCAAASSFYTTLNANDTLYIKGMTGTTTQTQTVNISIQQGAAYTLTWDPVIEWPGGTAPTLTAVAGKVDEFTLIKRNGVIRGNYVQNFNR